MGGGNNYNMLLYLDYHVFCDIELEIIEKVMNMTKIWLVKLVRVSKP